jgi:hypothetical protein
MQNAIDVARLPHFSKRKSFCGAAATFNEIEKDRRRKSTWYAFIL